MPEFLAPFDITWPYSKCGIDPTSKLESDWNGLWFNPATKHGCCARSTHTVKMATPYMNGVWCEVTPDTTPLFS